MRRARFPASSQALATAEAERIEARYSDEDLERLIRAHGLEPESDPAGAERP